MNRQSESCPYAWSRTIIVDPLPQPLSPKQPVAPLPCLPTWARATQESSHSTSRLEAGKEFCCNPPNPHELRLPSQHEGYPSQMKVLIIDIGGTNVKVASTDNRVPLKIPSGPEMTAKEMVEQVLIATHGWKYDRVSIGYPGPVVNHKPLAEPHNLAPGWVDFPYQKALGKPIRFMNDAAMQALGGYQGGRMLFLGTGTGLGSAMIFDGIVISLELAHLPYKHGRTYEEYIGAAGLERRGKKRWHKSVLDIASRLRAALVCDYVLLGGGNAKLMKEFPGGIILGANSDAIDGGFKLWDQPANPGSKTPVTKKKSR